MSARALGRLAIVAVLAFGGCSNSGTGNPCANVDCSSRGFCVEDHGGAYCACIRGFHPAGLACVPNDPENPCLGIDCSGHGTCRDDGGDPICDCEPGYQHLEGDGAFCGEVECDLLCVLETGSDADADADHADVPGEDDADGFADADAAADADAGADADAEPVCPNAIVEGGEECDDGNPVPLDGCENDCTFSCHSANECADEVQCTDDACISVGTGRICANTVSPGLRCDDGNPCTEGDACDASGACAGGTSTCVCEAAPDCAPHEDGDLCNGVLVCRGRVCVVDPATVVVCPSGGDTDCRRNACVPATGICSFVAETDGTACSDGLFCTAVDRCGGGECRGSGDPCPSDPCARACDDGTDSCPLLSAGTECRAPAGPCDAPETCTGSSVSCPGDVFRPGSYVCRLSGDTCDLQETCTGSSASCPPDGYQRSDDLCRAPAGPCDVAEYCTGSSSSCPSDTGYPDGTVCADDGTLCGRRKDCHVCRGGRCELNSAPGAEHWDASCLPSCGTAAFYCGGAAACCPASAVCPRVIERSHECEQCCDGTCGCVPDEAPEVSCEDGRDNDCDGDTDCDDTGCLWRWCGGARTCVRTGCCSSDPCGGCECGDLMNECGDRIDCGSCGPLICDGCFCVLP